MQAAADYWSQKTEYAPNWFSFCADLITERVTGATNVTITQWALQRAGKAPAQHLLEIGCLDGRKALKLKADGYAGRVSGCDIADGALARGADNDIALFHCDLNHPVLPAGVYDAIISNGVLHHIQNLEVALDALYLALEPGGVLIASEYTGPVRYKYSRRELALINQGISALPSELQAPFCPTTLEPKLRADPSESIRSRDIELVLGSVFGSASVEAYPYGGNVLQRAMGPHFFGHLDLDSTAHREAIKDLVRRDNQAMAAMQSHHTFFICRK